MTSTTADSPLLYLIRLAGNPVSHKPPVRSQVSLDWFHSVTQSLSTYTQARESHTAQTSSTLWQKVLRCWAVGNAIYIFTAPYFLAHALYGYCKHCSYSHHGGCSQVSKRDNCCFHWHRVWMKHKFHHSPSNWVAYSLILTAIQSARGSVTSDICKIEQLTHLVARGVANLIQFKSALAKTKYSFQHVTIPG